MSLIFFIILLFFKYLKLECRGKNVKGLVDVENHRKMEHIREVCQTNGFIFQE